MDNAGTSRPTSIARLGSAYAIHVLVRYYRLRADHDCPEAVERALVQIGPTVLAAGLTTVAGLLRESKGRRERHVMMSSCLPRS